MQELSQDLEVNSQPMIRDPFRAASPREVLLPLVQEVSQEKEAVVPPQSDQLMEIVDPPREVPEQEVSEIATEMLSPAQKVVVIPPPVQEVVGQTMDQVKSVFPTPMDMVTDPSPSQEVPQEAEIDSSKVKKPSQMEIMDTDRPPTEPVQEVSQDLDLSRVTSQQIRDPQVKEISREQEEVPASSQDQTIQPLNRKIPTKTKDITDPDVLPGFPNQQPEVVVIPPPIQKVVPQAILPTPNSQVATPLPETTRTFPLRNREPEVVVIPPPVEGAAGQVVELTQTLAVPPNSQEATLPEVVVIPPPVQEADQIVEQQTQTQPVPPSSQASTSLPETVTTPAFPLQSPQPEVVVIPPPVQEAVGQTVDRSRSVLLSSQNQTLQSLRKISPKMIVKNPSSEPGVLSETVVIPPPITNQATPTTSRPLTTKPLSEVRDSSPQEVEAVVIPPPQVDLPELQTVETLKASDTTPPTRTRLMEISIPNRPTIPAMDIDPGALAVSDPFSDTNPAVATVPVRALQALIRSGARLFQPQRLFSPIAFLPKRNPFGIRTRLGNILPFINTAPVQLVPSRGLTPRRRTRTRGRGRLTNVNPTSTRRIISNPRSTNTASRGGTSSSPRRSWSQSRRGLWQPSRRGRRQKRHAGMDEVQTIISHGIDRNNIHISFLS